ncbi:MFS transporter [Dactylosporangium sp. AC04546]|uniref:MFS transporter n=1 Tax=Dactylosporangium sp. AC04546 TaxID=2862460 RepID=UPI001EDD87E4|nr:MFS transporter [Dactylosporangium sp. AC04546]WVK86758.1 MFS transporter [Dactylosporangium sp. AC04546]
MIESTSSAATGGTTGKSGAPSAREPEPPVRLAAPVKGQRLWARAAGALPAGRVGRRLVLMALVDSTGTGVFLAVSAIFLSRSVGLSISTVTLGLSLGGAVALLTAIPVGGVADRFGPKRVLVVVSVWRAVCYTLYAFVTGPVSFIVVVCTLALVDRTAAPIVQALVGQVVAEDDRVRTMAVMRSLRNVGFTVGAMLGGAALALDTRAAYSCALVLNGVSFAGVAIVAARLPWVAASAGSAIRRTVSFRVLRDRPYLALALLNAVLTLHMPLLAIGMPLWIVTNSNAPKAVVAPLLAVNTVLAVVLQVRASRGSEHPAGAAVHLRRAGISLAVCCGLLALLPRLSAAQAVGLLVLCILAHTAGELYQSSGGWGLSFQLAKEGQHGAYLSVFWLGVSLQQIGAPILMDVVIARGPAAWVALGAVIAVTGLAVPAVTRWAVATRAREAVARGEHAGAGDP